MKPDFVRIMIPNSRDSVVPPSCEVNTTPLCTTARHTINYPPGVGHKNESESDLNSPLFKFIVIIVVLLVVGFIASTQNQINRCGGVYEDRISSLESEVQRLAKLVGSGTVNDEKQYTEIQHLLRGDIQADKTDIKEKVTTPKVQSARKKRENYYRRQSTSGSGVDGTRDQYQSYDRWVNGAHQYGQRSKSSSDPYSHSDRDLDSNGSFETEVTSRSQPHISQGRTYSWNRTMHTYASHGGHPVVYNKSGSGLSVRNREGPISNYEDTEYEDTEYDDKDNPYIVRGQVSGAIGSSSYGSTSQRGSTSSSSTRVSNSNPCTVCGSGVSYPSESTTYQRGRSGTVVATSAPYTTTTEYVYPTHRAVYPTTTRQTQNQYPSQGRTDHNRGNYPPASVLNIGGSGSRKEPELATMLQIPHNVLRTSSIDMGIGQTNLFPARLNFTSCNITNPTPNPCANGGQSSSSYNYTYVQEYSTPERNYTTVRQYSTPVQVDHSQSQGQTYTGQTREQDRIYGGVVRGEEVTSTTVPPRTRSSYSGSSSGTDFHRTTSTGVHVEGSKVNVPQTRHQYKTPTSCTGPKPLAAHYVAEASNGQTDANYRLMNSYGIFQSWKAADWMTSIIFRGGEGSLDFIMSPTGTLTVKKAGLYYVYAQIHYEEEHHLNGFIVEVNSEPFIQCTTMSPVVFGERDPIKSNSCFTAGLRFINADDKIVIKDVETHRHSVLKAEKSFFGLMNIGGSC